MTCRPSGKLSKCRTGEDAEPATTYAEIVRRYKLDYRQHAAEELGFYANQPTMALAIENAALCRTHNDHGKHSHQRRIPNIVLDRAWRALKGRRFGSCRNFDQLHSEIERLLLPIRGIGDLTVYDIAHRIGAKLNYKPMHIYLHAGTKKGARALGLPGENFNKATWANELSVLTSQCSRVGRLFMHL